MASKRNPRAPLASANPPPDPREPTSSKSPEETWRAAQVECAPSFDLVKGARQHLAILRAVSAYPSLTSHAPTAARAVSRYFRCWLPLLHEQTQGGANLAADNVPQQGNRSSSLPHFPPLDVLWVWLCHRLNPVTYQQHCTELYGTLLDCPSTLLQWDPHGENKEDVRSLIRHTRSVWTERYPADAYDVHLPWPSPQDEAVPAWGQDAGGQGSPAAWSQAADDVLAAVQRQGSFAYQVGRAQFRDKEFLAAAEQRYRGFLYVMLQQERQGLGVFCVPTYDIDLMWHTHQLCPSAYAADCKRIFGRLKDHDDKDSDRAAGSKLSNGFKNTSSLWYTLYGTSYSKAGCMYRGAPPTPTTNVPENVAAALKARYGSQLPTDQLAMGPVERSQEPQQPDKLGLEPREMLEALVTVRGVGNIYGSGIPAGMALIVRVEAYRGCEMPLLQSTRLAKGVPFAPVDLFFATQFSMETQGLKFSIVGKRGLLWPPEEIWSRTFWWHELLKRPSQTLDGRLNIAIAQGAQGWLGAWKRKAASGPGAEPFIDLSISVVRPQQAPYLLAMVPSAPVDSSGTALTDPFRRRVQSGQTLWRTRTVVDDFGEKKFVVLLHQGQASRPRTKTTILASTAPDEATWPGWGQIELRQGKWTKVPGIQGKGTFAGSAPGLTAGSAEARRGRGKSGLEEHQWSISVGSKWCVLDVRPVERQPGTNDALGAKLACELDMGQGTLACLLPGRALEYGAVASKKANEDSFMTLVRFPEDVGPEGQATALINFRTGVVEVRPGEDVPGVLLLCAALGVSAPILFNSVRAFLESESKSSRAAARVTPVMLGEVPPAEQQRRLQHRRDAKFYMQEHRARTGGRGASTEEILGWREGAFWGATAAYPWYTVSDTDWYCGGVGGAPILACADTHWGFGICNAGVCGSFTGGACGGGACGGAHGGSGVTFYDSGGSVVALRDCGGTCGGACGVGGGGCGGGGGGCAGCGGCGGGG